jgi:transposase
MRGSTDPQLAMLTVSTEELIPVDHPIRRIRAVVDAVLAELDPVFDSMYAGSGRASVPPETLLKATVLMALYSIRPERAFCERLNYDLLFKWFLDMRIDQPAFDASTFSKNRMRLLDAEVALPDRQLDRTGHRRAPGVPRLRRRPRVRARVRVDDVAGGRRGHAGRRGAVVAAGGAARSHVRAPSTRAPPRRPLLSVRSRIRGRRACPVRPRRRVCGSAQHRRGAAARCDRVGC